MNTEGPSLNHMELVDAVTGQLDGVSRATVVKVLRATFDVIGQTLAARGTVSVTNFGRFATGTRRARNPITGETGLVTTTARWAATGALKTAVKTGQVPETFKKAGNGRPARSSSWDVPGEDQPTGTPASATNPTEVV